jgi:hypothetical protein
VNAVIEISEVGEVMHPGPLDRLSGTPAFAHRLEVRALRPDLGMAIHAGLGRGYSGKGELLDSGVTVAAVYAIIADVMFVAELNGLLAWKKGLGVVGGSVEFEQQPDDQPNKEERAEDGDFRNEVRASIKDLPHRPLSSE